MEQHRASLRRPTAPQVEEALVASQPGWRREIGGRGIDDELRAGNRLLHLVHAKGAAAGDLEVPTKAPCLVELARDDPDFGSRLQGGGNGPGGAAGADDGDAEAPTLPSPASGGGYLFVEGAAEPFDVGVPAFQCRAVPADGVDRANAGRQRIQGIEEGDDRLLVRDGDVGAEDAFI